MTRRIVSTQLEADEPANLIDGYSDKLIKYIPSDVVGAYTAASGIVASQDKNTVPTYYWIIFVIGLLVTALWTLRQTRLPNKPLAITQTAISTGAFLVWAFALGGPFANVSWYAPVYGGILLSVYTFLIPILEA